MTGHADTVREALLFGADFDFPTDLERPEFLVALAALAALERERDTLRAALRLYLGEVANQIGTERRCSCFARDDPDHGPACCCGE